MKKGYGLAKGLSLIVLALSLVGCEETGGTDVDLVEAHHAFSGCGPVCESLCRIRYTHCLDGCGSNDWKCRDSCARKYTACMASCECPGSCTSDGQCPAGSVCHSGVGGTCATPCQNASDCQSMFPVCGSGNCLCVSGHCAAY